MVDSYPRRRPQACYLLEECPQTDTMGSRIQLAGQAVLLERSNKTRNPQLRMPCLGSTHPRHNRQAHAMPLWPKQTLFLRRPMLPHAQSLLLVSTYRRHSKLCNKCSSNDPHEDQRSGTSTATPTDLLYGHLLQTHLPSQFLLRIKPEPRHDPTWLHKKPRRKGSKLYA